VVQVFADFENVSAWQLIGYDGETPISVETDGKILFARDRDQIGVEGFVLITRL
jgi:hypothetical protein